MNAIQMTKRIVFGALICFLLLCLISFGNDSEVLHTILTKLKLYQERHPQEKLYLHIDKPFYAAGDSIWFKAYLVESSFHKPDSQSRVIYAELIDSAHSVIQRRILPVTNGLAHGDFILSPYLHQGKYLIRAYTNYMKNTGEDFFFLKELNVLNPDYNYTQLASSQIFSKDSIDLEFFPEGGNLVACGKLNRIAFKALSPDGRSFTAEGYITDDRDSVITTFKTEHDGMGFFAFVPKAGRKYYAQIRKPYEIERLYELPEISSTGITLQVTRANKYAKIMVYSVPELNDQEIHLVIQSRGKVYHAQSGVFKSSAWFTYVPDNKLPQGISHITVFDSFGRPLAERLVYQTHEDESVRLLVEPDSTQYGARQHVVVYVDAAYRNGTPAKGSYSISVYDDKLLQSPDQYPITIETYLSLTSDLKGNIENPGYYFKDTLAVTAKHLDLLMMVNGWSKFTWQDVLDNVQLPLLFAHEKGIPVRGTVVQTWKNKSVPGMKLKLLSMTGQATVLKPDSLGNFYTDAMRFYDTIDLVARTEDSKGKPQPYKFRVTPMSFPPVLYSISQYTPFDASLYTKQQREQQTLLKLSDVKQLDEFAIVAKRIDRRKFNPWGKTVDVRKIRFNYYSIYDLLRDKVPGLTIKEGHPYVTGRLNGKTPALKVNGEEDDPGGGKFSFTSIGRLKPSHVDMIEITKSQLNLSWMDPAALAILRRKYPDLFYPFDVINLMLKPGGVSAFTPNMGTNQIRYPGFYKAREFYSPRYDKRTNQIKIPDKRSTLYWEPMLQTDKQGRAAISFYTGDVASRFRIVIEGITQDGYPGTGSTTFEVK